MTRLTDIKEQLLEARKETQAELNSIDKALDAIGIQRDQPAKRKPQQKTRKRMTAQENIDRALRAIRESDRPLRRSEISEAADLNPEVATKALYTLKQQGKIRVNGVAPGKGRSPLYEATEAGKEDAEKMREDLRPDQQIRRIEDQVRTPGANS